jgi:hypothetical protein
MEDRRNMSESVNEQTGEIVVAQPAKGSLAVGRRGMELRSLDDYWRFAGMLMRAPTMIPKGDTQESLVIKMQLGAEVGMTPMAAIQNIAVINGKPGLYGDGLLGVCQASPVFDWEVFHEWCDGEGDQMAYHCRVARKGGNPIEQVFSVADAKRAGLWGKQGPWTQTPRRMLQWRARSFACRDAFADVLRGMRSAEELMDFVDVQAQEVQGSRPAFNASQAAGGNAGALPPPPKTAVDTVAQKLAAQKEQAKKSTPPTPSQPPAGKPAGKSAAPQKTKPAPTPPVAPPSGHTETQGELLPDKPDPLAPDPKFQEGPQDAQNGGATATEGSEAALDTPESASGDSGGLEDGLLADAGDGSDAPHVNEDDLKREAWEQLKAQIGTLRQVAVSNANLTTEMSEKLIAAMGKHGIRGKKRGEDCSLDGLNGLLTDLQTLEAEMRSKLSKGNGGKK